jgi:16S rRNA (guanine966-N2)-methyltransferase
MRIIGGRLRGLRLNPPNNLPVRPTTDLAKEALFNILYNQIEFEDLKVSMEFASRGAASVTSVDRSVPCIHYLNDTARQHKIEQIKTFKADVFKYLDLETDQYDMIFADPPYDLNSIPDIAKIIFEKNLLLPGGMLIVEHQSMQNISQHPAFVEQRKYGHSSFSFFKNLEEK